MHSGSPLLQTPSELPSSLPPHVALVKVVSDNPKPLSQDDVQILWNRFSFVHVIVPLARTRLSGLHVKAANKTLTEVSN